MASAVADLVWHVAFMPKGQFARTCLNDRALWQTAVIYQIYPGRIRDWSSDANRKVTNIIQTPRRDRS